VTEAELVWISSEEMFAMVSMKTAIRAVQRDLQAGLDPAQDFSRSILDIEHGQLLYMPSQFGAFVGAKVSTVAPQNPTIGRERIQGIYLLMDSATLGPIMLMDGQALTALRTPAVSAAVADYLAPPRVDHLVVFGSGTQAWGHVEAMRAIRSVGRVTIVARDQERGAAIVNRITVSGLEARLGAANDVRDAQIIACATSARSPLFDGGLVPDDSLSVAVGSHEPDARELDSTLIGRAQLVVEDPTVALREAGDVIIPINEGRITGASLVAMRDIVMGTTLVDQPRPRVFKSSGMPWEDLVVAAEVYRASATSTFDPRTVVDQSTRIEGGR
jgi:ornithine cyclodeaminase/alanine dehydrogenase-like protein (mu-crystallin family)